MKKRLRGFLANTILTSILLILLGVAFIVFPQKIDGTLYLILFSALLVLGGGQFIFFLRNDKKTAAETRDLVNGLALFLVAFFVYFRWNEIQMLAQYLFAFLIAFSGIRKLQSSIHLKSLGAQRWFLLLIAAAIGSVYGAVLLFIPFSENHMPLLYQLLGSGFVFSAIFDIVASVWISVRLRQKMLEDRLAEKAADPDDKGQKKTDLQPTD